jgi:type I restriction enzyme, R subunit
MNAAKTQRLALLYERKLAALEALKKPIIADNVPVYRNRKLAVDEAKAWDKPLTEGVGQAKDYATKMAVRFVFATNGRGIYGIDMETGKEGELPQYPTPTNSGR